MREKNPSPPDRLFIGYLTFLIVAGFFILFSASQPAGIQRFQNGNFFVLKQLKNGLLPGIILLVFFLKLNLSSLKKSVWLLYILSILLLLAVFIPGVGVVINGARSWISIFGFSFQPAEFAKIAVAACLAWLISEGRYDWERWQSGLLISFAILSPILLLILKQPDLGTLIIIAGEIFGILAVANVPVKHLLVLGAVGLVGFSAFVFFGPDYRMKRITVFLNPEANITNEGYQLNQAFVAAGSGGFWGRGLWNSRQKYQYLPEASADTIFAVAAEELGFLGASILVILMVVLLMRGLKISKQCSDRFGSLLAAGIVIWFGWQSMLNVGATIGALPLTGVPLPFVSHGGSALAMALAASGIILSISKETYLNK